MSAGIPVQMSLFVVRVSGSTTSKILAYHMVLANVRAISARSLQIKALRSYATRKASPHGSRSHTAGDSDTLVRSASHTVPGLSYSSATRG